MQPRTRPIAIVVLLATALALGVTLHVRAATPQAPSSDDTMKALLAEVHALRLAMEHSAAVAPRVQLTLARLGIEEQRTTQIGAQLDQARRQLADVVLETQRLTRALEDVDKALQEPIDDTHRKGWEQERGEIKRKLSAQAAIEQQLRSREGEYSQMLATEQARWVELNGRLDDLDRQLGPIR
jgi:hypothetical protein